MNALSNWVMFCATKKNHPGNMLWTFPRVTEHHPIPILTSPSHPTMINLGENITYLHESGVHSSEFWGRCLQWPCVNGRISSTNKRAGTGTSIVASGNILLLTLIRVKIDKSINFLFETCLFQVVQA